jgi:hypothetical protein
MGAGRVLVGFSGEVLPGSKLLIPRPGIPQIAKTRPFWLGGIFFAFVIGGGCLVPAQNASANDVNISAPELINSQHFEFEASCRGSGKDMVYAWNDGEGKIPSPDQFGKSFIYPWLGSDVLIRGLELAVVKPWASFVDWLAVGNNTWGDFMLLLGNGASHGANFYPGAAFRFPGKNRMTPLTYIDLHGSCWHPFKARVFLELYYTPADDTP